MNPEIQAIEMMFTPSAGEEGVDQYMNSTLSAGFEDADNQESALAKQLGIFI